VPESLTLPAAARAVFRPSLPPATAAVFGLIGPIAYLTPLAMAVLMPVLALVALARSANARTIFRAIARAGWPASIFPLIALLSALWAITPGRAVTESLRLLIELASAAALVIAMKRLDGESRTRALAAIAIGYIVIAPVVLVDSRFPGVLTGWARARVITDITIANTYSRGAIVHALLMVPLTVGLWRAGWRRLALAQLVVGLLPILLLINASAKSALLVGMLAALAAALSRLVARALVIAVAAVTLLLPLAFPLPTHGALACRLAATKSSAVHRMHIWNFTHSRILERPLLGWGMDASRAIPGGKERVEIRLCTTDGSQGALVGQGTVMSLHPHNAVLQVWLELGALGGIAAALLLLWYGQRLLWRADRPSSRAAIAAVWAASFTSASLSFGIWQSWWVSSLAIALLVAQLAAAAAREGAPAQSWK
jgi:O-antigen ligase